MDREVREGAGIHFQRFWSKSDQPWKRQQSGVIIIISISGGASGLKRKSRAPETMRFREVFTLPTLVDEKMFASDFT